MFLLLYNSYMCLLDWEFNKGSSLPFSQPAVAPFPSEPLWDWLSVPAAPFEFHSAAPVKHTSIARPKKNELSLVISFCKSQTSNVWACTHSVAVFLPPKLHLCFVSLHPLLLQLLFLLLNLIIKPVQMLSDHLCRQHTPTHTPFLFSIPTCLKKKSKLSHYFFLVLKISVQGPHSKWTYNYKPFLSTICPWKKILASSRLLLINITSF